MEGLAELERRNASGPEAWMQEGAGADETLEAFVVRRNGVGGWTRGRAAACSAEPLH